MDLCFNSRYENDDPYSDDAYYGGILIRGIRSWAGNEKPILGSGKVCDTLLSVYNAFENKGYDENMPQIIGKDDEFHGMGVKSTLRYHIADIENGVKEELRFVLDNFEEAYRPLDQHKSWETYFDKNRLGNSRAKAEKIIKDRISK